MTMLIHEAMKSVLDSGNVRDFRALIDRLRSRGWTYAKLRALAQETGPHKYDFVAMTEAADDLGDDDA